MRTHSWLIGHVLPLIFVSVVHGAEPAELPALLFTHPRADADQVRDEKSFATLFSALGVPLQSVDCTHTKGLPIAQAKIFVIPAFSAKELDRKTRYAVLDAVRAGALLLTDGESPFSEKLGITLSPPRPVAQIMDLGAKDLPIIWGDKPSVPTIAQMPASVFTTYYTEKSTSRPMVVSLAYGSGHCLFLSAPFDPLTGQGYARFPHLPNIVIDMMLLVPKPNRSPAEAYFDPDLRAGVPMEKLTRQWKEAGLQVIYAAAWDTDPGSAYDYKSLIMSAHEKGLKVFAWFEWPHVSQSFWDNHPACREKTSTLADAHVDWRYLMNLQDPGCFKSAVKEMKRVMNAYDWDGVNLAELYFEPVGGQTALDKLTPMNPNVRKEFRQRYRYDPHEIFDPASKRYWQKKPRALVRFHRYRKEVLLRTLVAVLKEFKTVLSKAPRRREMVVTVIDVSSHPDLADAIGIDLPKTIQAVHRAGATLQIEDPYLDWAKGPERYAELGQRFAKARWPRPAILDINVVPSHSNGPTGFPTDQPTGMELLQLWRTALSQSDRVCFYAESTLTDRDWQLLPFALAHD